MFHNGVEVRNWFRVGAVFALAYGMARFSTRHADHVETSRRDHDDDNSPLL